MSSMLLRRSERAAIRREARSRARQFGVMRPEGHIAFPGSALVRRVARSELKLQRQGIAEQLERAAEQAEDVDDSLDGACWCHDSFSCPSDAPEPDMGEQELFE